MDHDQLMSEVKAVQAASPIARGLAAGATYGAAQAAGETASKGDFQHLGENLTRGAFAGGLTGGLLEESRGQFDPAAATPLERLRAKNELIERLASSAANDRR
jgi:hypothetical protein